MAPDLTGTTLGDFHLLRKLGQGGMGQVYLARQLSLKRDVALKLLNDDLAANPTALARFQAEAEAVARATHANIVQVYAVGEHAGLRYMALEFVDGRNLKDYLAKKGPPELSVALAVMRQVAAALQRASELGLVHRDIKPENILLTRKAEVKVTDFGLSRYFAGDAPPVNLTQSGMTLGTPLYMSPEQVQGKPVDHRSDIYSFGVTCYHLLAGHPPFSGASPFEVAVQHVQAEPPPLAGVRPDLPADLCGMVHKMMAKRPDDRYATARDVIRDLNKVQKGLAVELPPLRVSLPATPAVGGSAALTTAYVPPGRLPRWPMGLLACGVAAGLGWAGYGLLTPDADAKPAPPGLPDARPPEPVVSGREHELRAVLESRTTPPRELVDAALALGLLLVDERRLDEAEKVFQELEQERFRGAAFDAVGVRPAFGPAYLVGRLGQAVVLAHRDKAVESTDLFERTLVGPPRLPSLVAERFLLAHPAFTRAIADALTRNADNRPGVKANEKLDWLRTPAGLIRGPK